MLVTIFVTESCVARVCYGTGALCYELASLRIPPGVLLTGTGQRSLSTASTCADVTAGQMVNGRDLLTSSSSLFMV